MTTNSNNLTNFKLNLNEQINGCRLANVDQGRDIYESPFDSKSTQLESILNRIQDEPIALIQPENLGTEEKKRKSKNNSASKRKRKITNLEIVIPDSDEEKKRKDAVKKAKI